jgi:bla regulator protein blaR1
MIPADWTSMLANHLWQSTVVAAVAALLALALHNNQARIRYWLWLIASLKLLVPFSLLVALASHLTVAPTAPLAPPKLSAVMHQVTQPFPELQYAAVPTPEIAAHSLGLVSLALGVWLLGVVTVVCLWSRRWLRIRTALRAGSRLPIEAAVPVISSPTLVEPGIFGILRPVLLLPEGMTDHLTREHLEAILAHELCHVRRRDNLAAAIHMAVEAIFWFYPLVWWIGSRLVDERERACDEEVLRLGNEPAVYAESILKICQFYLESPLVCVSGITGSDLKQRIVRIMTHCRTDKLSLMREILLVSVAMAVIAAPVLFGFAKQSDAQPTTEGPLPSFEVASVKPNRSGDGRVGIANRPGRFTATNITPKLLIEFAYNIKDPQLSGGPSWIDSEHYDIDATSGESPDEIRKNPDQFNARRRQMVRSLLADRFKLTLSHETKDLPVYALVVAKGGPKFHETTLPPPDPNNPQPPPGPPQPGQPFRGRGVMMRIGRGQLNMNGAPMSAFADALSEQVGRKVIDKTDLKGNYDLALQWTPEEGQGRMFSGAPGPADGRPSADSAPPPEASSPSIFTAVQEQLGLKLESQKGPVEMLVISHIEQPSEN